MWICLILKEEAVENFVPDKERFRSFGKEISRSLAGHGT